MRSCREKLAQDESRGLRTAAGDTNSEGVSGGKGAYTRAEG